jgi:hypothetical protein
MNEFHDGITKLSASRFKGSGTMSVSGMTIRAYATGTVSLSSTGSQTIYDPADFVPENTCTYIGSGNWTISLSDNCIINTNYNLATNEILLTNTGNVTFNSSINVTNFPKPSTSQSIYIDPNAYISVS